ncbi:MAG: hypothetical protein JW699_04270 [Chitinispirillaceae bacterium]|nr:hypothetical protein [Chitinispirillaceae bacterium]
MIPAVLLLFFVTAPGPLHAAPKGAARHFPGKYIGKDYIDTTVQRAIFLVNDAANTAGVGFRQKEAIAQAKEVARRLRSEVKGDPNERYALWKVGELEWLIYLEEKDLVLQKVKQGQATLQQLIAAFNTEMGKPRPDFRDLVRLRGQMAELDARRAGEMDDLMRKRSARVSREAVVALEKALMCGGREAAEQEFRYCLRNRPYLVITQDKFDRLETQASACERSREEMPLVRVMADSARALLRANRLGEARDAVWGAKNRLIDIRTCASAKEAGECMARINCCERDLGRLEDSLVRVTIELLRTKGADAASRFLDNVLRKAGVCHEKVARVDQAVIAAGSPPALSESRGVSRVVDDVASSAEGGGTDVFAEMRKKAKIRAQFKLDSIEIEKEERARIVQARLDSIEAEAKKAADLEFQKNQETARTIAAEIYGTIEKNKARVAFDLFNTRKPFMHQYLMPEAFALLENTVLQAVDPRWAELSLEIAYLSAAPSGGVRPAPAERPKADKNREKAETIIALVYDKLEHNDVRGARKQFDREKSFLRTYLDKETYDVLATTVRQVGD